MKRFGWLVVGCSMPAMSRQERRGRQELIAALNYNIFILLEKRLNVKATLTELVNGMNDTPFRHDMSLGFFPIATE